MESNPCKEEILYNVVCEKLSVTAMLFEENLLYTAQGGTLQAFKVSSNETEAVGSISLFKQSVIYGISTVFLHGEKHLLCFGGKSMCIIKNYYDDNLLKGKVVSKVNFKDWIWDVIPITYKNSTSCHLAIALAHNSVLLYNHRSDDVIKEVHCAEKCILYSAHFVKDDRQVLTWEQLKVCCGTVFNQIIIWKPHDTEEGNNQVKDIIRLSGHEGVIFNLSFNPATKILLSASDDRSIRVWRCPYLSDNSKAFHDVTDSSLCAMYGHQARVWKVESFLKNGQTYISSAAEDGFCIMWKLLPDNSQLSFLIVRKMDFRSNLLSLALHCSDQLAVGGADGSVRVLEITNLLQSVIPKETVALDKDTVGVIKTIKLLTKNNLSVLAHTDVGALMLYVIASDKWNVLERDSAFGSYATIGVNDDESLIALGNTKGFLKVVQLHRNQQVRSSIQLSLFHGKVLSITWCQNDLFVSGPNGIFKWYNVHEDGTVLKVMECYAFTLPRAKHRWHTAVAITTFDLHMIVCGDRRGSVHTFVKGTPDPVSTAHGVHGKLGVTSLKQDGDMIISTGRDGRWRTWSFEPELQLQSTHRASQGMSWLEGCDVVNCDAGRRLYVYGFHGNKFIVWSKWSGDELFSVSCGGGHRSWDFSIHLSKFVFLKAGKLNVVEATSSVTNESIISPPLHSQHINCVRHLATYSHSGATVYVVATAGEDTNVMVSAMIRSGNGKPSEFQTLCCLDDHLSNVRCIATVSITDGPVVKEMMMYTAGGRGSLNAYHVKLTKDALASKVHVSHLSTYTSGAKEPSEMRFMSLAAWSARDGDHKMAVACSDGKIRIFHIKDKETEINILCESKEYPHCFLTASWMNGFVLSGSTSGKVYFMTSSLEEVTSCKGHQSGVNSIAWVKVEKDHCLVASGGDDNAIHLALFGRSDVSIQQKSSLSLKQAHSAQITGLHVEEADVGFLLSSVSIDQRMTVWRVQLNEESLVTCQQINSLLIHVADVAGMDTHEGSYFFAGEGLVMLERNRFRPV